MKRLLALLTVVAVVIIPGSTSVMAASAAPCALTVAPAEGPPGTEFVFSGAGYTPTQLTLRQPGKAPTVSDPSLHGADPFSISLIATEAEAGRWTVTASIPGTDCAGTASIKVTLPSTATTAAPTDPANTPDRVVILFGLSCLITLFLFTARHFNGRFASRS